MESSAPWTPSRRATGVAIGVIAGTAGVAALLATRYAEAPPWIYVSHISWVLIWTTCGLVAWRSRPLSRIGPLMVVMGALFAMSAPGDFPIPSHLPLQVVIPTLGILSSYLQLALWGHMFLTYPSGRPTRFVRRFLTAVYVVTIICGIAELAIYHTYLVDCGDECGVNIFGVRVALPLTVLIQAATSIWFAVLAVTVLVMLVHRFLAAADRERRTLWFPLGSAAGVVLLGVVYFATDAVNADLNAQAAAPQDLTPFAISFAATWLAVAAVPVAFLVGLLRERLAFAGVADLVGELGRVGPDQVQPGLARVLGDPGLRVLFPVDDHGGYVDVDGRPARVEVDDPARVVTPLGDRSAPLGVLVHDPALLEHRELLDAAGAAARLALENARLQAEVRAQLAEVRASRARLVDVADAERRRLERDLHDGAQQRLLGMGMTLQTLRGRLPVVDAGTDRLFQEATGELRSALRELRDLAQGIHPAVLTDQGLTAALGLLARRCPLPVIVQGELSDRPAAAVEAAAYYLASEALQNTVKHAHAGRATIGVHRDGDALVLDLVDDGVGGADLDGGTGLRGLHDRVTAINGTLTVHSPPGGGTHLSARLPWT